MLGARAFLRGLAFKKHQRGRDTERLISQEPA
jgi:hypothetical protein